MIMQKEENTQKMIDSVVSDQYTTIGKLHQMEFLLQLLKPAATEAVDIFSNYVEEEHEKFMFAVGESLDYIDTLKQAIDDTKTLLKWMRARRSEIFKGESDE